MPYSFVLPRATDLTISQQSATNEGNPVAICGGPGTGKSVVALWRHMQNHDLGLDSVLLTYTETLKTYLSAAARSTNPAAADEVFRTLDWLNNRSSEMFEIIVDEAQDISEANYRRLQAFSERISYGADDQQSIYRAQATTQAQLSALFPANVSFDLDENFRNTWQIMEFVRAALPGKFIPAHTMSLLAGKTGPQPRVIVTGWDQDRHKQEIIEIIRRFQSPTHNIAVLVPFPNDVDSYHAFLTGQGIVCSSYQHEHQVLRQIENVHVTTFASAKGTEFDTVIIPEFQKFRRNMANYRDVGSSEHYYVAFTRTRTNLFLLSTIPETFIDQTTFQTE